MQIRQVDVSRLEGVLEHPEPFWDDVADSDYPLRAGSGQYRVAAAFVAVLSDAGLPALAWRSTKRASTGVAASRRSRDVLHAIWWFGHSTSCIQPPMDSSMMLARLRFSYPLT